MSRGRAGWAIGLLLGLVGCAPPTEEAQLADFRASLAYTTYHAASATGLPMLAKAYAASVETGRAQGVVTPTDVATLMTVGDLCKARAVAAFGAMARGKDAAALAEADLIHDGADCGQTERNVATGARAVVFHRQQWPRLSEIELQRLRDAPSGIAVGDGSAEVLALHGMFAIMALQEDRIDEFRQHVENATLISGQRWLAPVADIVLAAKEQRVDDVLRALKTLSDDTTTPPELRALAVQLDAEVEAEVGDLDAPALGERLVAAALWSIAKAEARERWGGMMDRIDGFEPMGLLDDPALEQRVDGALDELGRLFDGTEAPEQ